MFIKPCDFNRETYKTIKRMDRQEMFSFLTDLYETGRRDYDLDELREVISAIDGIGKKRCDQIIDAVKTHYRISEETTESETPAEKSE